MRESHMNWPWVAASERLPEWTEDGAVRVLALTADDDFGGQQIHDISAADFYVADPDGADPEGTEVTRACTHWVYRDDVWPSVTASITWPKARDVGRIGDMSPSASMRVGLDSDNDVYVSLWGDDGGSSVEFCCPGSGGGRSSRTRMALIALMVAIEADNAETPSHDWWARRNKPAGDANA